MALQGNSLNESNPLNRSKYSDSNWGLRFGGPWIEIEGDFAEGPGPPRQAGAGLHAVVDFEPDHRRAFVRTTRAQGGVPDWACHDRTPAQCARLDEWNDALPCHADRDPAGDVLSAFCGGLQKVLGHAASRGKGMEIP